MNIVFIGCGEYGYASLEEILAMGKKVVGIFTLKPELAAQKSTYKSYTPLAEKYGVPIFYIEDINSAETFDWLSSLHPDLIIEISWSQLIKKHVLELPRLGTVGMHISLLPKHRGHAPINWALINGEKDWGLSMFYLTERADKGEIIGQEKFQLEFRDTCATAYHKAGLASIKLLRKYLPELENGTAPRIKQDDTQADYYPKRTPKDGKLDWHKSGREIVRFIRAITHPYPGAFSELGGKKILLWEAYLLNEKKLDPAGIVFETISGKGIKVTSGDGQVVLLTRVQAENGLEMWADDYFKEYHLTLPQNFV